MTERQRRSDSFVLRIWWEDDVQPVWRGRVQHATSGETRHVQHLSDLLAFIETYTGSLAQAPAVEGADQDQP